MDRLISKITPHPWIRLSAGLVLLGYLLWELYWYQKVGLYFINWHTHLMLYVYVWLILYFIFRLMSRSDQSPGLSTAFLLCSSVLFALLTAETLLAITGTYKTYMEKSGGHYQSPNAPNEKNYYHIWPPNKDHYMITQEYSFPRHTNSLGFSDPEWAEHKKTNETRIMALGDSFTEGDGAPYDSTYVAILRHCIRDSGDSAYVMNAGICGSDPFNNYINLKDRLIAFHPDIIIQSISSADMDCDILLRGGMERFQKDGTVKYKHSPWWEPIYALSYISRIYFTHVGYNELLRKKGISATEKDSVNKNVEHLFDLYADLCCKNGIRLYVVIHPEKGEVENHSYHFDLSTICDHLARVDHIPVIDLLPSYIAYIDQHRNTTANYYWVHDGHHNSRGYKMMAETTWQNLLPYMRDSTFAVR